MVNNRYLKIGGTYDLVYNMSVNMGESKGMKVLNVLNIVILLTICHFAFGVFKLAFSLINGSGMVGTA